MSDYKFLVGQVVRHKLFGYRGVVFDMDESFRLDDKWYEKMAKTRPPKDRPWYRLLVDGKPQETYVAERNLVVDTTGGPIHHPLVEHFFDELREDHYARTRDLN